MSALAIAWISIGICFAIWSTCELVLGWSFAVSLLTGLFVAFWMVCFFGLVAMAERNDREGWW